MSRKAPQSEPTVEAPEAKKQRTLRQRMQRSIFKLPVFMNREVIKRLHLEPSEIHNVRRVTRGLVAAGLLVVSAIDTKTRAEIYSAPSEEARAMLLKPVKRGRQPQTAITEVTPATTATAATVEEVAV